MTLNERIGSFSELGNILRALTTGKETRDDTGFSAIIEKQYISNPWFTPENVRMAVSEIADKLTLENLKRWTDAYPELKTEYNPVRVGVIMAGNIPLVGFHDFLTVLISGNNLVAKTSSKDSELIKGIAAILFSVNGEFRKRVEFTEGPLRGFDIVIATGSDNSSRYFEYYFGRYPNIIRKNRNSIAIIQGDETDSDFRNLGKDIFSYFGLGCRNVSKVYLPAGFNFEKMIRNWDDYSYVANHNKYANNYEYNMAVFMVNRERYLDTGYLLLRENRAISSPVAVLNYQYYSSPGEISEDIASQSEKIQCIVSKKNIPFGMSQSPDLWDYADNTDTLDFLLKKKMPGIM